MSAEIVHSLIKNTEGEILKCKNDIFEATIKFVDISDKYDMVNTIIKIQNKTFDLMKLKFMVDHLQIEKIKVKQQIENLKLHLQELKENLQTQKKMIGM